MRVLVACEFSGIVRDAFRERGHDAYSCDLLPTERPSEFHVQGDVLPFLYRHDEYENIEPWDLLIGHPPCTYLCNSGAKHLYAGTKKENGRNPERWHQMDLALLFLRRLWSADVPYIAIENPIMLGYAQGAFIGKPTQIVQPWMFGHGETKATCLWTRGGMPKLRATNVVNGRVARIHRMAPGANRGRERSRTYQGIANAMAEQWGALPTPIRAQTTE